MIGYLEDELMAGHVTTVHPPRESPPAGGVGPSTGRTVGRQLLVLLAAAALMAAIYALPSPPAMEREGNLIALTTNGKACLAIMAFAVILWVTETLPFAATSLLIVLLIPAFGVADYRSVVRAGFGDPVITFFIGVLMLSAAFTRSGLGTRLAYRVLSWVGTRTDRVLFGFLLVGTLISWWITDMAVAAMLLPIAMGIATDAGLRAKQSNFGRALLISVAFGPLIGGIATPAGTAANIVALAQLEQLAGVTVTFTGWMWLGVPASLLMVPIAWRILLWIFPPEIERLPMTSAEVAERLAGARTLVHDRAAHADSVRRRRGALGPFAGPGHVDRWSRGASSRSRRAGGRRLAVPARRWRPHLERSGARHRVGRHHADRRGAVPRAGRL